MYLTVYLAIALTTLSLSFSTKSLKDDKNNITQADFIKIKKAITGAQATFLPTQLTKIAKYVYDNMSGPTYQRWQVFIYTPKMNDISVRGYYTLQGKWIWISDKNVTKYNLTYAMFQIWICNTPLSGGFTTANFSQDINQTFQKQIYEVINNSILYRGLDMNSASEYIQTKLVNLNTSTTMRSILISSSNSTLTSTSFGYYRCGLVRNDLWVNLRGYGEFKWNYYIFSG